MALCLRLTAARSFEGFLVWPHWDRGQRSSRPVLVVPSDDPVRATRGTGGPYT